MKTKREKKLDAAIQSVVDWVRGDKTLDFTKCIEKLIQEFEAPNSGFDCSPVLVHFRERLVFVADEATTPRLFVFNRNPDFRIRSEVLRAVLGDVSGQIVESNAKVCPDLESEILQHLQQAKEPRKPRKPDRPQNDLWAPAVELDAALQRALRMAERPRNPRPLQPINPPVAVEDAGQARAALRRERD